jgi:hypothetical protein
MAAKAQSLPAPSFSIKNTFIDDAAPEIEPVIFRSLQANSDKSGIDFASIAKLSNQRRMAADGADACPSTSGGDPESATSRRTNPELILPLTHENLQIRNTFIHIGDATTDGRAVQSMPHGMFKQCLLSEAAEVLAAEAFKGAYFCDTPTSAGGESPCGESPTLSDESDFDADRTGQSSPLSIGALVKVEGLVKLPAYNGCSAVVQGWDESTGRYNILIASPGGLQQAKIKEENLSMLLPCP